MFSFWVNLQRKNFMSCTFRFIMASFRYLILLKPKILKFIQQNVQKILPFVGIKKIICDNIKNLFFNNFFIFLRNSCYLIYFNDDFSFFNLYYNVCNICDILCISYNLHFCNNTCIKNITKFFRFFSKNYKKFVNNVFSFFNNYIKIAYTQYILLLKVSIKTFI